MSDLRKAAEAVLERWDSPAWEWIKQGPTAELMATLRTALAAPRPEPVAWMYVNLEGECEQIEYGTEAIDDDSITPLYAAPPTAAPSEDIEALRRDAERLKADNERLRGLLAEASKAVWMNYDNDLLDRIEAALKEVPR